MRPMPSARRWQVGLLTLVLGAALTACGAARSPQFQQMCQLPFGTPLAYEGDGLSMAELGLGDNGQPAHILVTANAVPIPWGEPAPRPRPGALTHARIACVDYGEDVGAEMLTIPDDWEPPPPE